MDRRSALKHLLFLGGGIILAPSCQIDSQQLSVALTNLNINPKEEDLLAEVVDILIPTTDTPGAKELNIHHFVLVMVDDCRSKEDQEIFSRGLKQLGQFAEENYDASFIDCSSAQREALVSKILSGEQVQRELVDIYESVRSFLLMTKKYTIQGFLSSQYVMTNIFSYQMVPGHYDGCVPLEQV